MILAEWTKHRNNDTVIVKPHINYTNVTTIPVVKLLGTYNEAEERSARIRARHIDSSSKYSLNATGQNTTIIVQSTFYRGWKRYLKLDFQRYAN